MTKVKVSHLKDLTILRASKEAKLVLVLLVEALVPLARGEVVDLLKVVGDDNKLKDISAISHYRMLRTIQI